MINTLENQRRAARAALPWLDRHEVVGIGTGSTVHHFIDLLAADRGNLKAVVSSSNQSTRRLEAAGITVVDLNEVGQLPVHIDGADQTNTARQLIKGGGGALTREKIIAAGSRVFVCIVDATKLVPTRNFPLPVEVIPMARALVAGRLAAIGGRPVLRAGYITDNGNHILDVHDLVIKDPVALESALNQIPGVVTVGLFALAASSSPRIGAKQRQSCSHDPLHGLDCRRKQRVWRDVVLLLRKALLDPASPREPNLGIDVHDRHARSDRTSKIGIGRVRAAVQRHENPGSILDGSNPLDVQMLPSVTRQHTLQDPVHVADGRSQRIDPGLLHELHRFIRCRERAVWRAVVNLRAATDIADLSFDEDIRTQRFESEDRLLRLPQVVSEWER
jgi:ribose 5-phosphate isomerase A